MEKVIRLYTDVKDLFPSDEDLFPSKEEPIITSDFTYSAKRMGDAPTITCSIKYKRDLENDWSEDVVTIFNGEKYYLRRIPTSTYDNTDTRYKYDLEFVSERIILNNVFFIDVVKDSNYKGATNSTSFMFSGDIHEFVKRMNYSLQYAGLQKVDAEDNSISGYVVIVDDGVESETHNMSFEEQYFSEVLQEVYNTYEIPYYFKGKEIHIGTSDSDRALDTVLAYGEDNGLLSISKQNANHMVVNRITGVGSSDNIPYYYPNETPLGEVEVLADQGNNILSDTHFTVVNPFKLTRAGLASEDYSGNVVRFCKIEPNRIVTLDGVTTDIRSISYLITERDPNTEEDDWWGGCNLGELSYTWLTRIPPSNTVVTEYNDEKYVKHSYHVKIETYTQKRGGVLKWFWKNNPFYKTFAEQKRENGDFNEKVFDNLEAYEVIGGKKVKTDVKTEGTYPSLYIATPFLGEPVDEDEDSIHRVEVHLKFDFWKEGDEDNFTDEDISYTNFISVTLDEPEIDNPYYWSSSKASYSDIKEFGVDLSSSAKEIILNNPDSVVGDGFYLRQLSWIAPQPNLMPSIYRTNSGTERFYNAINNTYPIAVNGVDTNKYYEFPNPYVAGKPHEYIENFEDIKPSIDGMTNKDGAAYNQFLAIAYDEGDNDSLDEEGNLIHPYFFAKLPTMEFNLFDHAIENGAMQFAMTSGNCAACTFEIGVDSDSQKNVVQVDAQGNLQRDAKGNVVTSGVPQDRQNDTKNYTVWIALKKDVGTFPSIMPNIGDNNKPTPNTVNNNTYNNNGDTFSILNISLPQEYITSAEKRLDDALIKFMHENNTEKFNFSVKFSRIYLAEHPEVLRKINENASVIIRYNETQYTLYVSSITYKMKGTDVLPEISVELADTISTQQGAIAKAISQVKADVLNSINTIDFVRQGIPYFLRKDIDDRTKGRIRFLNGIESDKDASFGGFQENTRGAGIFQDKSGNWHIEADYLRVRKKLSAQTVEIEESHHIGGSQMLTAASAVLDYVIDKDDFYRCYFLKTDDNGRSITNKWVEGDQAYCKVFNLEGISDEEGNKTVVDRFYWRKVIATDLTTKDDLPSIEIDGNIVLTSNYHFIDLSKQECAEKSDVPRTMDNVVQLGYQGDDKSRQNAIIMAGAGEGSPYIRQFTGINSFTLPAIDTQLKPGENILSGETRFKYNKGESEKSLDALNKNYEDVDYRVNNLKTSTRNMVRNSGFTGDFETMELEEGATLKDVFELYSPSLEHWDASNATAQESDFSQSGKEVLLDSYGEITQRLSFAIYPKTEYVLSWCGKGGEIQVEVAGLSKRVTQGSDWQRYIEKFESTGNSNILSFSCNGSQATLCEIQLEQANVASDWNICPLDNNSELAMHESLAYLADVLKQETTIEGGVINTGLVNTGVICALDYTQTPPRVTAGMSGRWQDNNSIAFFAGGDMEQAVKTVSAYSEDASYQPTDEELANMAKVAITHGGRAILHDIILRGYVYADGGVFKGKVYANDGEFNGKVVATNGEFNGIVNAIGGSFDGNIDLKGNITATGSGKDRFNSISIDGRQRKIEITGPSEVIDDWGTPSENAVSKTYMSLRLGSIALINDKPYVTAYMDFGDPYTSGASVGTHGFRFTGEGVQNWLDGTFSPVTNAVHIDGTLSQFQGLIRCTNLPTDSDYDKLPHGCIYRDGETLKIKE